MLIWSWLKGRELSSRHIPVYGFFTCGYSLCVFRREKHRDVWPRRLFYSHCTTRSLVYVTFLGSSYLFRVNILAIILVEFRWSTSIFLALIFNGMYRFCQRMVWRTNVFVITAERRLSALVGTEGGANNRFAWIIKQPSNVLKLS